MIEETEMAKRMERIMYQCVRCGEVSSGEKWERTGTGVFKCPVCSYKVARKTRPPIVKRVKSL